MNIMNLIGQVTRASNPMSMLMGMLNPNQKQLLSNFQNQNSEKQAEEIAKICNQRGISKSDLAQIINSLKGGN